MTVRRGVSEAVVSIALAVGLTGCLGSAPQLPTSDQKPDATSEPPEGGEDATVDTDAGLAEGSTGDDAAEDASGEGGSVCLDGGACAPSQCQLGASTCSSTGTSSCTGATNLMNGSTCDAGADASAVCNQGACAACNAGADCTPSSSCHRMTVVCASGTAICTADGLVADGTSCGTNLFCRTGNCAPCVAGSSCPPSQACMIGTASCSAGALVCGAPLTAAADGTPCGTSNEVCKGGQCVACVANAVCTPPGNACHTGKTSCASGTSVCVDMGAGQNGVACPATNGCEQTYTCSGGTCTGSNPVSCPGDSCHGAGTCVSTGATTHSCTPNPLANGTSCGTNEVCTGGTCGCSASAVSCSGACVNETNDPNNCGACGLKCVAGTCAGGVCTLGTLVDDVASGETVVGAAVDANGFYVALSENETIERCPIAGCISAGPSTVYSSTAGYLLGITASSAGVFWSVDTTTGGGAMFGCSPSTSCASNIETIWTNATWQTFYGIAADATNVYWPAAENGGSNGVQVLACPAAGCKAGPMSPNVIFTGAASDGVPEYLTSSSGYLFWLVQSHNTIVKCPVGGCPGGTISQGVDSASGSGWDYLTSDSNDVYWSDTTASTLLKCGLSGCSSSPTTIASNTVAIPVSDSTNVYWTVNGAIYKCAVGGRASPTTVVPAMAAGILPYISVDSSAVYFVSGTTMMKVAK